MVQHETGNGLYAYPRGRPGRDSSQIGEKLPCPVDVDQKLSKLRLMDKLHHKKVMDPHRLVMAFVVVKKPRRSDAIVIHAGFLSGNLRKQLT